MVWLMVSLPDGWMGLVKNVLLSIENCNNYFRLKSYLLVEQSTRPGLGRDVDDIHHPLPGLLESPVREYVHSAPGGFARTSPRGTTSRPERSGGLKKKWPYRLSCG